MQYIRIHCNVFCLTTVNISIITLQNDWASGNLDCILSFLLFLYYKTRIPISCLEQNPVTYCNNILKHSIQCGINISIYRLNTLLGTVVFLNLLIVPINIGWFQHHHNEVCMIFAMKIFFSSAVTLQNLIKFDQFPDHMPPAVTTVTMHKPAS